MAVLRDKLWIFGVRAHQDDIYLGKNRAQRNYAWSRITPGEAALMLDVPNMIMVNCDGIPVPFSCDGYGYAESFCRLDKVLWGATGSAGFRVGNEEKFICELARKYPNIAGAFMDDFFGKFEHEPNKAELQEKLLREIRAGLDQACRKMELYVVWYASQFKSVDPKLMDYIDGLTIWTWNCTELTKLEERFQFVETNFPKQKKLLGIYMFDFPTGMPVPLELMEHQCELGLKLIREGRLDGMILEANSVMGVGLPSELWLRKWLDKVKMTEVPD